MSLKTGAVLLIGIFIGMASASKLQSIVHNWKITALQVAHCTKGDKAVP